MISVNSKRLWQRLTALSGFTKPDRPWTRRAFSEEYRQGRQWLQGECSDLKLRTRIDNAGNLVATLPGSDPNLPSIYIGSHSDTVTSGGRFDGIAGVVTALEVANSLIDTKYQLRHNLCVIDFLSEEPSDFGISCIGSRAISGELSEEMLDYTDTTGSTLRESMQKITGTPIVADKLSYTEAIHAFLELHIEQGPVLEHLQIPIGIVTHIVGINRYEIIICGQAGHAGTIPMEMRADALAGAAYVVYAIRQKALEYSKQARAKDVYFVATVGRMIIEPNNSNVISGATRIVLEVRSTDDDCLADFIHKLDFVAICGKANAGSLKVEVRTLAESQPVKCARGVTDAIKNSAEKLGHKSKYMASGAGHDAAHMALLTASGMIFIPCKDGLSHCPDEWSDPEQLGIGADVALQTVLQLDQSDKIEI